MKKLRILVKCLFTQQKEWTQLFLNKSTSVNFKKYLHATYLNFTGYYYNGLKNNRDFLRFINE